MAMVVRVVVLNGRIEVGMGAGNAVCEVSGAAVFGRVVWAALWTCGWAL